MPRPALPTMHSYPSWPLRSYPPVACVYLSIACLGYRAQAKLAALQATAAEPGTNTATLRMIVDQKEKAMLALRQEQNDKQQQAELHRLGLGSLLVHAPAGESSQHALLGLAWIFC